MIHESEVLGYDADFSDERQYCKHGTWIGSWWGPDYLCGPCEDGVDICAVCGAWDGGQRDPNAHVYVGANTGDLCRTCLAAHEADREFARFHVEVHESDSTFDAEGKIVFRERWEFLHGAANVGDAYRRLGDAVTKRAMRGWYATSFRIVDRKAGDRVVFEHDPSDFVFATEDEEVQA